MGFLGAVHSELVKVKHMVNGTYQPITHIGAAYGINQGGEGSGD